MAARATPATRIAQAAGALVAVHAYDHDPRAPSYALEAAEALGLDPAAVFKTLVCRLADGEHVVAIVPAADRLDLKALAAAAGGKRAVLADPAEAERATGYVVGGISPLGQRKALPTVVDESALGFGTVLVSAGRRGLQVELPPAELVRLTRARTAPIGRC